MPFADTNAGRTSYVAESTFNVTPASPNMKIVRMTSSDFAATKETIVSDEIRNDRMVSTVTEVAASSGGSINIELSLGGSFDDFIEAALCGTWTTAVSATNVAVVAGNKFSATGAFTNAQVGQWVYSAGFTTPANNGWFQITAKTNDDVTVAGTLTVEAAGAGKTVKGRMVRNGKVARSFSIEQAFTDINQYFLFAGQRLNTMSLDIQSGSAVTGSFAFMGAKTERAGTSFATSTTAATTTSVVNATSNVGTITEGGVPLVTALQAISLSLDNALRAQNAVGSKFPKGIGYGRQTVTGSLTAYFESGALYDKFLQHQTSSLSFDIADAAGNRIRITLPKVFFTSDNPTVGGTDQDVMENLEFTAVYDSTLNCQIQIDMIAA